MDPAKVFEVRPVAEPSAHLEKRVVHPRVSVHVANGQPVERKTARETEAADSDGREAGAFFLVFLVVEPLVTLAVHDIEPEVIEGAEKRLADFGPREAAGRVLGRSEERRGGKGVSVRL